MSKDDLDDGGIYTGALFYTIIVAMFNGLSELAMTIYKLPVFYKQRDMLFFPPWAYALPTWVLKIPISFLEVAEWTFITYYVIGFDPNVGRLAKQYLLLLLVHQYAGALFRFIGAAGRNMIVANTFGLFALLMLFALGGFVLSRENVKKWWLWGYWSSPMMYAQNAILVNEFTGHSWSRLLNGTKLGIRVMESRGFFTDANWYWLGVGASFGFVLLFNIFYLFSLTFLDPFDKPQAVLPESIENEGKGVQASATSGANTRRNISSRTSSTRQMFVEEVMELVELTPLKGAIVGLPGVNGLSTEQRKRLTIAVELVANPSIIFMDEPTSGLDARAAIVFPLQFLIEIPYIFAQSVVYGTIVYAMMGFKWTAEKYFWFIYFLFISLLYFVLYGMMAVGVTPNHNVASIISSFFYAIWNLFSGFIIPRPKMPVWWRWYNWVDPISYSLYGFITSQYGDINELMTDRDQTVVEFLRSYFGFKHDMLGFVAAMLLAFVILFTFIFAFDPKFPHIWVNLENGTASYQSAGVGKSQFRRLKLTA